MKKRKQTICCGLIWYTQSVKGLAKIGTTGIGWYVFTSRKRLRGLGCRIALGKSSPHITPVTSLPPSPAAPVAAATAYHEISQASDGNESWMEHAGSFTIFTFYIYLSYLNIFQVDASYLPIQSSWHSPFTSTTRSLPPFSRRAPCRPQGLAQIKECIDGEGDGPAQIIEITWDETAIDDHRWPLHNTHQQSTTW